MVVFHFCVEFGVFLNRILHRRCCTFGTDNGSADATLGLPLPSSAGVQMAAEALLHRISLHVPRFPRYSQDAGSLRPFSYTERGRELLRLRLGQ